MTFTIYGHPFSSYCQKVLIALEERAIPYEFRMVSFGDTPDDQAFYELWPIKRIPVLVNDGRPFFESSVIIEHIDRNCATPLLIPAGQEEALATRMMDRIFDNYVMTPMQKIVFDYARPPEHRDPFGVADARKLLDTLYIWLNVRIAVDSWAMGDAFTLADCSAAPALFYADWVHEIPAQLGNLRAYRARLNARPSFARCIENARPFRHFFPPGAPERD